MRVEEVELPGVGRKFTAHTHAGDELVVVVQHNGNRRLAAVHILAVSRGGALLPNPSPDLRLAVGDALLIAGRRDAVDALRAHLGT